MAPIWINESVVSDSLRFHGLHSPWNPLDQNTGVGSLSLLQGIFPTQGSNPGLPHCRWILYQLSHKCADHQKFRFHPSPYSWSPLPISSPSHLFLSGNHYSLCPCVCFYLVIHLFCFFLNFLNIPHEWNHTVFVFPWLTSTTMMPSKSIHVVANGKILSFF